MTGMHVSVCRAIINTGNCRPKDDLRFLMHRNRFRGLRRKPFHLGAHQVSIGFNAHWEEPRGGFESRVLHNMSTGAPGSRDIDVGNHQTDLTRDGFFIFCFIGALV